MLAMGIILGPAINFFLGLGAATTAYYAHKAVEGTDLEAMEKGQSWYGEYGARNQILVGFFHLGLYLFLFGLQLCGCCLRKPKSEHLPPLRPENEDKDVKAERERV